MELFGSMKVKDNTLFIGEVSTMELAKEFGTPLYVLDEKLIRDKCKRYYNSFKADKENRVAYAGKAFLTIAMCQIIDKEGLCLDVVSGGELFTAIKAGFPMDRVYFHGNNKTENEIYLGVENNVGRFVVDNLFEIEKINSIAKAKGNIQKILLRITPGIEAHTHDYIKTGQIDSKFGFTIVNGGYLKAVEKALTLSNIELVGLHCHIGSQILELKPYEEEAAIMMELIKNIYDKFNYRIKELDLGGGFGIHYRQGDQPKSIEDFCSTILNTVDSKAKELDIPIPKLAIEPGRSIIGKAGTTLYTVGSIKEIPEIRKYVSVDGGMTDNIRPALYKAEYECCICDNVEADDVQKVSISGKCCESGDILMNDVILPEAASGDILAVLSTGAYCYSMSSNYNKIPRAAVVLVNNGKSRQICRRETYEDIIKNELRI